MTSSLHRCRRGTTTIELVVSFTMLATILGFSVPLLVRHQRVLVSARQYRIALDELSNQAERLSLLDAATARRAIDDLRPSDFAAERLPGAKLTGDVAASAGVDRATLALTWDEPGRNAAPVSLVVWLPTAAYNANANDAIEEEEEEEEEAEETP